MQGLCEGGCSLCYQNGRAGNNSLELAARTASERNTQALSDRDVS